MMPLSQLGRLIPQSIELRVCHALIFASRRLETRCRVGKPDRRPHARPENQPVTDSGGPCVCGPCSRARAQGALVARKTAVGPSARIRGRTLNVTAQTAAQGAPMNVTTTLRTFSSVFLAAAALGSGAVAA